MRVMCARKSFCQPAGVDLTSGDAEPSPVRGNTVRSRYRVLRLAPRGVGRSVDRDHAGRNAKSVKVLSPVKNASPRWPSKYEAAKATLKPGKAQAFERKGAAGVRVHGMYEGLAEEPRRSLEGRARSLRSAGRGRTPKSAVTLPREVRSFHSSDEAE